MMGGYEQALLNPVSQHGAEGLQFAVDFLTCVIAFGRDFLEAAEAVESRGGSLFDLTAEYRRRTEQKRP